jgi:hypothetical protein
MLSALFSLNRNDFDVFAPYLLDGFDQDKFERFQKSLLGNKDVIDALVKILNNGMKTFLYRDVRTQCKSCHNYYVSMKSHYKQSEYCHSEQRKTAYDWIENLY